MRRVNIKMCATLLGISLLLGLAWVNCAQATLIAYDVVAQTGNQAFAGSLGMDFDVNDPIKVVALGIFDSGADGLHGTIYATIYNRDTGTQVVAPMAFTPSDSGTLIGGSRFKDLADAVVLTAGHYSIVSWGYSVDDLLGNAFSSNPPYAITISTLDDGSGAISFVGSSRFDDGAVYPTQIDHGPVNRYLAGTFAYDTSVDPIPVPATVLLLGSGLLGLGLLRRWARHPKQ